MMSSNATRAQVLCAGSASMLRGALQQEQRRQARYSSFDALPHARC